MGIYKKNDSIFWWGRFAINRKRHAKSLRTTDRREAERRFEAWKSQTIDAVHFGIKRMSWPEAVNLFLADNPGGIKPATMKRYIVSLRQAHDTLGDMNCDQIQRGTLIKWIGDRKRQRATPATINRDLTAISRVLAHAVYHEAIERNPCDLIQRRDMTRERRDPIEPPSDADVFRLINECPPMLAAMVRLLGATGMRLEECASLEWRQIDTSRRVIKLFKTKTSRPRTIDMGGTEMATVQSIPRHIGCPFVFWHGEPPGRYVDPGGALRIRAKRAGVKFRNHDLRHKHAIDWLQGGGDIYKLSRRLGHSSVKTTEIYLGYLSEMEKALDE